MNTVLISTLVARQQSKKRIIQLAGKLTPPRYSWPRTLSNPNIQKVLGVVSDAADAAVTLDIEQRAETASRIASSGTIEVHRSFSPRPNPKEALYNVKSASRSPNRIDNTPQKHQYSNLNSNSTTSDILSLHDLTFANSIDRRSSSVTSEKCVDCSSDSLIRNMSDASDSDVSLSELKEIYIAKENGKRLNDYVKARIMRKRVNNNEMLKVVKRNIKTKSRCLAGKKNKRNDSNRVYQNSQELRPMETSRSTSNRLQNSMNTSTLLSASGTRHSYVRPMKPFSTIPRRRCISPGKMLEQHAAERIKAAFIPSSGQVENNQHNIRARQQSDDRAKFFLQQSCTSRVKVDFS
jgi:hypothetical protein